MSHRVLHLRKVEKYPHLLICDAGNMRCEPELDGKVAYDNALGAAAQNDRIGRMLLK